MSGLPEAACYRAQRPQEASRLSLALLRRSVPPARSPPSSMLGAEWMPRHHISWGLTALRALGLSLPVISAKKLAPDTLCLEVTGLPHKVYQQPKRVKSLQKEKLSVRVTLL